MLPRVAARRAAALATSSAMTAAPRGGAARRALADAAPKKDVPPPPPPPPSGGGGGGAVWFALAALAAGGAYVFQDSIKAALGGDSSSKPKEEKPKAPAAAPAPAPTPAPAAAVAPKPAAAPTPAPAPATTKKEVDQLETRLKTAEAVAKGTPPPVDWNKVRARVVDLLDDEQYDDGSWGPVFVRLAWHAAGTYDNKTKRGGSEGAYMRFADEAGWGANAGLALPRARLEALKKEFPGASFADLWSFAGTVAIEEMGGPKMNWRPGRKDAAAPLAPALPGGLLPDADGRDKKEKPADHLRDIFYRMGFNDREIVALSGGHALGRCHTDRSGFWGPWTRAPTTFSNEYYRLLLEEKWTPKKTHKGQAWTGPAQFEDKTGDLMMLPTDLALVQDPKMRPIVEQYAKDEKAFFNDFAKAWIKLQELGVPALQKPWWKVW